VAPLILKARQRLVDATGRQSKTSLSQCSDCGASNMLCCTA